MKAIKTTRPNYSIEEAYSMMPRCALCGPVKKNFARRITPFIQCRENFIKYVRGVFKRKSGGSEIDQSKTRLIILKRVANMHKKGEMYARMPKENLEKQFALCAKDRDLEAEKFRAGLRIANHFERRNGWQLSKFYKIDPGKDPQQVAFMVVGSPRWQKTPHYLSLFILILRAGFRFNLKKGWPTEDVPNKSIIRRLCSNTENLTYGYYSATVKKWDALMKHQDRIVGRHTMKEMFDRARLAHNNNGYSDGIYTLCQGNSYDLRMSYRFQKVCREIGIHQRVNVKPDLKFIA